MAIFFSWGLVGCIHHDFSGRAIRQGNLSVSTKVVDRLKLGMSKQEVVGIMGSSLITPPFQKDRWDYAHSYQPANHAMRVASVSLYFNHDRLVRIERH